jgi:murein DD-endopeptidase MepM/ murein hydrolase activator NlpD
LDGVVTNVISTNIVQGCGYGKWVMVKHSNGISTLYAHLSLPTVAVGDNVPTGQVIGYSGNTGFTTGPHLHFGVYVTQGFQTTKSVSCPGVIIPYTAQNGYLNPLSYL